MNKVVYTPGPWRSRKIEDWWSIFRRDDELGFILADVYNKRDVPVVRALPELVEACQIALKELVALGAKTIDEKSGTAKASPACKALRAALARAAGKRNRVVVSHR